jgi:hypothetical protein
MIYVIQNKKRGEGEAAPVYWRGQGQPLGTKKYYTYYALFGKVNII